MSRREATMRRAATRAADPIRSLAPAAGTPPVFGQDARDDAWLAEHGSRAERRSALNRLRAAARRGDPAAVEVLAALSGRAEP